MTEIPFKIAASGGDYTSISGYVSGEAADLVAAGDIHLVTMDTNDLNDNNFFFGFTTDATSYIKFLVEPGREHGGKAGSGNRVILNTGGHVFRPDSTCDSMKFDGLGMESGTGVCMTIANGSEGFEIQNCFIKQTGTAFQMVSFAGAASLNLIRNTFLVGGGDCCLGVADMEIQFCSALGAANRCYTVGKIRNCIGMDATSDDFDAESTGSDFNLDSDSTAIGDNSVLGETSSDIFVSVTGGSEDLNLKDGTNNANGAGIDISGVTTDYEGDTRPDPPDIGADEFVAAISPVEIITMLNRDKINPIRLM